MPEFSLMVRLSYEDKTFKQINALGFKSAFDSIQSSLKSSQCFILNKKGLSHSASCRKIKSDMKLLSCKQNIT